MDSISGLVRLILKFLRFILPCRNLLTFKYRGLWILVTAIFLDIGFNLYFKWPTIEFELTKNELAVVISVLITFIFLVVIDAVLDYRRQKLRNKLYVLLSDPNVPQEIKKQIAGELLS